VPGARHDLRRSLKVTIRLTVYAKDPETGVKSVRDIKEQEVFFGEIR